MIRCPWFVFAMTCIAVILCKLGNWENWTANLVLMMDCVILLLSFVGQYRKAIA